MPTPPDSSESKLYKMGAFDEEGKIRPHIFQDQFFLNSEMGAPILEIVTNNSPVELMLNLAEMFPGPYTAMYDLISPQTGFEEGSYVWDKELGLVELKNLVEPKTAYIENDARHRLAVHINVLGLTLVVDEHNVLKSLPADGRIVLKLKSLGFAEQRFEIPFPHSHPIHAEYNEIEEEWIGDDRWIMLEPETLAGEIETSDRFRP